MLETARLVLSSRRIQRSIFPDAVFRDSCWDIMLMCFVGQLENRQLCVKQIHGQIAESSTALLRRIGELEDAGMIRRLRDDVDGRRTMVRLTSEGIAAMLRFFDACEPRSI